MKKSIYIFHRDFRIYDNHTLKKATNESDIVYPIFIITPEQINNNKYFSSRSASFMAGCLLDLATHISLCIFSGHTIDVLTKLIKQHNITGIYHNKDVSPFAKQREIDIEKLCKQLNLSYYGGSDIFLHHSINLFNAKKKPYLKFTPFYNFAKSKIRINIVKLTPNELAKIKAISRDQQLSLLKKLQIPIIYKCTRTEALNRINNYPQNYLKTRDTPSIPTTQISAYLHYGIISPQETYDKLPTVLQRQLIWREFYLYISAYLHVCYSKKSHTLSSRNIKWKNNKEHFKKWCSGKTGIPWVDAGMRELNATGFMHNRLRMNVAIFLIFYLQIDWRWGEKYFAQNLIDYDYAQNLGNWLWCASWESFANPYFRIFSMEQQMRRFDSNADYVKKWIPELIDIPTKDLYNWPISCDKYKIKYPKPIITDLGQARQNGIKLFSKKT